MPQKSLWGIINRRERWGFSWYGWLLLVLLLILSLAGLTRTISPFLAVTQRVETDCLVVEGWIPNYAIKAAADEFAVGGYAHVFTTGGPVVGMGGYTNDYNTSASVGATRLKAAGVPSHLVQMAPSRVMRRDRTYAAAIALRDLLAEQQLLPHGINVMTEGPHARRTQLLFQKAFGNKVAVGIVAIQSPDYDATHWWVSSEGVRDVVGEALAYVYAQVFFHPATNERDEPSKN